MKKVTFHAAAMLTAAWLATCGQAVAGCGIASLYTTSSGAGEKPHISAAHQSLPPGTRVIVRNQQKGRSIIVRIAGRTPSLLGRIIDLSTDAMNALGMNTVAAPVCVEVVSYGSTINGFRRIKMRNPSAEVQHAGAAHRKNAGSGVVLAHVHGSAKSARVASSKSKRYAQAHHPSQAVGKSTHRRLAAHS
jgi:rare lipoprotein A